MTCEEDRERLSAYIDGELSDVDRAAVDAHLVSCEACRTALADMRRTISGVRSLDEIEPPPWLTQKIMARVREEAAPKQSLWRRLFLPLHVKLPIEAAATLLVALTALYVFRTIEPQISMTRIPAEEAPARQEAAPMARTEKTAPKPGWTDESVAQKPMDRDADSTSPQSSRRSREELDRRQGAVPAPPESRTMPKQQSSPAGSPGPAISPAEPVLQQSGEKDMDLQQRLEQSAAGSSKAFDTREAKRETAAQPPQTETVPYKKAMPAAPQAKAPAPAMGAAERDEARAEKSKATVGKLAEEAATITLTTRDVEDAARGILQAAEKLGGKIVRVDTIVRGKSVTLQIVSTAVSGLLKQMRAWGTVADEKDLGGDEHQAMVLRIRIIAAE